MGWEKLTHVDIILQREGTAMLRAEGNCVPPARYRQGEIILY